MFIITVLYHGRVSLSHAASSTFCPKIDQRLLPSIMPLAQAKQVSGEDSFNPQDSADILPFGYQLLSAIKHEGSSTRWTTGLEGMFGHTGILLMTLFNFSEQLSNSSSSIETGVVICSATA
jgi:hypothetical protein